MAQTKQDKRRAAYHRRKVLAKCRPPKREYFRGLPL